MPLLLAILVPSAFAFAVPDSLVRKSEAAFNRFNAKEQETFVDILKDSSTVYYAATFKTLPYPYALARAKFSQVDRSFKSFSYIKKFNKVETAKSRGRFGTYLVVVGVLFARSWFLCDLDSLHSDSAGNFLLVINQNHDDSLNRRFRQEEDGLFVVEYNHFTIEWRMKDLGGNRTRASFIACVAPRIWIPGWLYRIVSKFVFPSVLSSFEKSLKKQAEAKHGR